MLTEQQKRQLDGMVRDYITAIKRTHKAHTELIYAWAQRYRIAMGRVLEKQNRRQYVLRHILTRLAHRVLCLL